MIGAGYVGLVSAACFAETGNDVSVVEIDPHRLGMLAKGEVPIFEPGLAEMIARNVRDKRLSFTGDISKAVPDAELVFIAVGTPPNPDGSPNLDYVLAAAEQVGRHLTPNTVVVTKSTVPVGTGDRVRERIAAVTHHPFAVASNPEFLKEGSAIDDFMKPDRVVLGADDAESMALLEQVFSSFVRTGKPVFKMSVRSAELTKYAANGMLAARISFMNEMANLCDAVGADIDDVRRGIGSDARIGTAFLFPGIGYGGSCFPKDVTALADTMRNADVDPSLIDAIDHINTTQKSVMLAKVDREFGGVSLTGKHFAMWGLAFKPNTDDVREAPAHVVIRGLIERGATVCAHDPEAIGTSKKMLGEIAGLTYTTEPYAALEGADALVVCTEWSMYRQPNFKRMAAALRQKLIFDGRNIYVGAGLHTRGFRVVGIGKPIIGAARS
jgi:UDPglucose 6-dehydrogenase